MENAANNPAFATGFALGMMAVMVLTVAAMWRIFSKAGEAGWKALIPIYGAVVFNRIVGRPGWWVLLMMIPVVNIVIAMIECADLARVFGKGIGYALGLIVLTPLYLMALAFGPATYVGPNGPAVTPMSSRPTAPTFRKAA